MPAISYEEAHGGAGWGTPGERADPAAALAAVAALEGQERWATATAYGRIAEQAEADLMAWAIANRPNIHAIPGLSEAERQCRDAQTQAVYDRWRE
jgi:hypothetical protein